MVLPRLAHRTLRFAGAILCACLLQPAYAAGPVPATLLEAAVPAYPKAALRADEEGTVHVRVRVLATGEPVDVRVEKSSGVRALDEAAVAAVRRSKFRAAQDATGEPVESFATVPFQFVLQD
ncbi:energy transducer TonB [Ramlibacter sp. AN1015]|uniref:energy transducer TonB n=1 Tax=Ramlibacter sp. AN1015 TaxID=3133428 RepID=UPI0030C28AA9